MSPESTAVAGALSQAAPALSPKGPVLIKRICSSANTWLEHATTLRQRPGKMEALCLSSISLGLVLLLWWWLTRGDMGHRILNAYTLPSLPETIASFPSLWFQRELSISALTSLARVLAGFAAAAAVAVPLGVMAGSYPRVHALLQPVSLFGRNVPVAALIPLTLIWFGLGEMQKVMFIFLATVCFVLFDTTQAVRLVPDRYLDTAATLGAHRALMKGLRLAALAGLAYGAAAGLAGKVLEPGLTDLVFWERACGGFLVGALLWLPILAHQALRKVVLPLALPAIVNSLRLIFGLAFGYIMLAEVINAQHGLGALIIMSQRQGPREHIYLCLLVISLMAWGIDQLIIRLQRHLFPYLKHEHE